MHSIYLFIFNKLIKLNYLFNIPRQLSVSVHQHRKQCYTLNSTMDIKTNLI